MEEDLNHPAEAVSSWAAWRPGPVEPVSPKAQVIDMFSGCGGMSLGFHALAQQSGFYRLVGAIDIDRSSLASYERNFGVPALEWDIRDLAGNPRAQRALLSELPDFQADLPLVLIGCAPCQGFSAYRKKNWEEKDHRNSLVNAFAAVAAALRPACVIMENVPELLSGRYWEHYLAFRDRMEEGGYTVKQAIHNAAEYGAPQERFRSLVVAMRNPDFSLPSPNLTSDCFRTVRDAIGDLPPVSPGKAHPEDSLHRCAAHRQSTLEVIRSVPKDGGSRPPGIGPACLDKVNGFFDVYGRLSWDKPAITITHYARNPASGRFTHPEQDRGLTAREAARLQGFPDNFEFVGTFDDVFRQIGEAVPPPLSLAVATSTSANLSGKPLPSAYQSLIESPVSDSYAGVIAGIKASRR